MVIGNRQWSPLENEGGRMVWKGTGELPGLWKSSIPRSVWWLYVYMYATKNPLICALKSQQLVNFVVVQSLCVLCFIAQSCPTLSTPWTAALQAPLPLGFSRQEHWSGLPCPSPGDLPSPGIEPRSPALRADSLPPEPPRKPCWVMSVTAFILYLSKVLLAWNINLYLASVIWKERKSLMLQEEKEKGRKEREERWRKEGGREQGRRGERKARLQPKGFPRTAFAGTCCPGVLVSAASVPDLSPFNW